MTDENVQDLQDKAVGQYTRLKQALTAAKTRMAKTGKEMESVGCDLLNRRTPEWVGFVFESYPWLNHEYIKNLAQEIVTAEREVNDAKTKAVQLGVAPPELD